MKKTFIVFTIIAIVTVFILSFLIQDKSGETEVDEVIVRQLRADQMGRYEEFVEAFIQVYPNVEWQDVWLIIEATLILEYAYQGQIEALQKGK